MMVRRLSSRFWLSILLTGAVLNTAAGAQDCGESLRQATLESAVTRGSRVTHALPGNLEFRLQPLDYGWIIWIGDPAHAEENFAAIATPPFHGLNPLLIEGWHFRNSDNTGPNAPGPKNVNAPQRTRRFRFVPDNAGFDRAMESLAVASWPVDRSTAEISAAREAYASTPKAEGKLDVVTLELGNLVAGERAWIELMGFTLSLCLPQSD